MFRLSDVELQTNSESQPDNRTPSSKTLHRRVVQPLSEVLILLLMSVLLFCGTFWQIFATPTDVAIYQPAHSDAAEYQCYAVAFWQGTRGVNALPAEQCPFLQTDELPFLAQRMQVHGFPALLIQAVASRHSSQPFHTLPYEYSLLALIPFTLPLLAPTQWYQVVFEVLMTLVAVAVYFIIKRFRSTTAAIVFVGYLVVGNWATAGGRFDLVTSALTLGVLILAMQRKWRWAFLLLALATLCKFYTLVLVIPLLLAQQMQCSDRWYSWRRWDALGIFVLTCAVLLSISLVISIEYTLAPIGYFLYRPIQIESLPAVLLWLGKFVHHPVHFIKSYGCMNIVGSWSGKVNLLSTLGLVSGLLYTFWLQWRGKLDIFTASLLTLLVMIVGSKVFSPQYLIWVTPIIAYIWGNNWKWLTGWGAVGILTTCIYPFLYVGPNWTVPFQPAFYPLVLVRDAIMLGIILVLLYRATRKSLLLSERPA
jgi:hypothetical protein